MPDSLDAATFEDVIDSVGPGKLIRSDVLLWMLDRLRDLEDRVGEGTAGRVQVPILTGRTLSDAAAILSQPSVQLRLGPVLDVQGVSVNPDAAANAGRIVLMQTPGPVDRAPRNALVRLVVTAPDEEDRPPPSITGFEEPVRVNEVLTITGQNFPVTWSPQQGDRVTFDGVEGTVVGNGTQFIDVRVPTGIPGVPDSGDAITPVTLVVTVRGETATDEVDVQPATQAVPSIDTIQSVDGGAINPESTIEVRGDNFAAAADENTVIFDRDAQIHRTASGVTDDGIQAEVPSAEDLGLRGSGGFVQVAVEVGGVRSSWFSIEVLIPS